MNAPRILIVEDESLIAMELESRLGKLGYDVVGSAASSSAAICKAAETHPDLALMDIMLQGEKDGIDTAMVFKERFDIPVVFLTAYADGATLDRAKVAEPFGYMLKPFVERELHSNIEISLYKHRMEKELRKSKAQYELVVNNIHEALALQDLSGQIHFANSVFFKLFKIEDQELSRISIANYIVAESKAAFLSMSVSNKSEQMECEAWRDNERFWIEVSTMPVTDDHAFPIGVQFMFRDITDRVMAEKAVKDSKKKLDLALQSARAGIWELDLATQYIFWSKENFTIFGVDTNTPITLDRWLSWINYEDRAAFMDALKECIHTNRHFEMEYRILRDDSKERWIHTSAELVTDPDSSRRFVLGAQIDTTEQKKTEEYSKRMEKLATIGRLAATVAHEIRNPLGAVKLNFEFLQKKEFFLNGSDPFLANIAEGIRRMEKVISMIVEYSRPTAFEFQPVSMTDIIKKSLSDVQKKIEEKKITVIEQYCVQQCTVMADRILMSQSVSHILLNAIDAVAVGGHIAIKTEIKGDELITIIHDNGEGILPENLNKVFEPFFTTRTRGSGLGLAITSHIIQEHHGQIKIESGNESQGTVVKIILPALVEKEKN